MRVLANFEVESDISIVADATRLKIVHPTNRFTIFVQNIVRPEYSTPFLLSVQVIYDAPTVEDSKETGVDRLVQFLNILAFVTGASLHLHRIRQIVDCTPGLAMRTCLVWAESPAHDDPQPFVDVKIGETISRLVGLDLPVAVNRAMRWYRFGLRASQAEDQFQYFWFALEIIAEYTKSTEKVNDTCPKCGEALYCKTCDTYPTHRPYPKQAIRSLMRAVDPNLDEKTIADLDKARNALMHGSTMRDIEESVKRTSVQIVDTLGRTVFGCLLRQVPNELLKDGLRMGSPSTYVKHKKAGVATISTVVPFAADGALDDTAFRGMTAELVPSRPPQSEHPVGVVLSPQQVDALGALAYQPGPHQEACLRIFQHRQEYKGRMVAPIFSADLKLMREVINKGEAGRWPDLCRELLAQPPPAK